MKQWSYLNTASLILNNYPGDQPFASFLKKFFSEHKKYGSNDRKQISHLCYCYFRLGQSLRDKSMEERLLFALFICSPGPNDILQNIKPEWNKLARQTMEQKWSVAGDTYSAEQLFPWRDEVSTGIDFDAFVSSFIVQPDLFLRIRPGKEKPVIKKLNDAGIEFQQMTPSCLALPNGSKVEFIIRLNEEVVIQDYNSQATGGFLDNLKPETQNLKFSAWDCCAASGGKSIMAKDILGDIDLTVSDVRESILINLRKRFSEAGIKNYKSFKADLAQTAYDPEGAAFDLIIADVPCTGSGTWGRTPEQLYYFTKEKIVAYTAIQKKIVANVIPALQDGGHFLYITCSVFAKENEEIVEFMKEEYKLECVKMEALKGYDKKADTLFAAMLVKRG